jgi:hypothetical protein
MTMYAFDSDRAADREAFHREVVEQHSVDARLDELDEPCRLPVRAVVLAGMGPQIELGPVSLSLHDAELLADSIRLLVGVFTPQVPR